MDKKLKIITYVKPRQQNQKLSKQEIIWGKRNIVDCIRGIMANGQTYEEVEQNIKSDYNGVVGIKIRNAEVWDGLVFLNKIGNDISDSVDVKFVIEDKNGNN